MQLDREQWMNWKRWQTVGPSLLFKSSKYFPTKFSRFLEIVAPTPHIDTILLKWIPPHCILAGWIWTIVTTMMMSTLRANPLSQHWKTYQISQFPCQLHRPSFQQNADWHLTSWETKNWAQDFCQESFSRHLSPSPNSKDPPTQPKSPNLALTWTPTLTKTLNILRSPLCEPLQGGSGVPLCSAHNRGDRHTVAVTHCNKQKHNRGDGHTVTAPSYAQVTDTTCCSK